MKRVEVEKMRGGLSPRRWSRAGWVFAWVVVGSISGTLRAGDWPRFLGPAHDARADAADARAFAGKSSLKKVWEFSKGKGWASPAVVGDRVLVFHRRDQQEVLDCLEAATGKELWRYAYEAPYRDRYGSGDGPRSSPVVDGDRVYVFGVSGQMHCVDLKEGRRI